MKKIVLAILCILVIGRSRSETPDPVQSQPTTPTHHGKSGAFTIFIS
jgi:hypothetical protein